MTYLVMGETGEYDEWSTWPVVVFDSKARADTFCRKANEWSTAAWAELVDRLGRLPRYSEMQELENPYDRDMRIDWNGTNYTVVKVRSNVGLPNRGDGAPAVRRHSA